MYEENWIMSLFRYDAVVFGFDASVFGFDDSVIGGDASVFWGDASGTLHILSSNWATSPANPYAFRSNILGIMHYEKTVRDPFSAPRFWTANPCRTAGPRCLSVRGAILRALALHVSAIFFQARERCRNLVSTKQAINIPEDKTGLWLVQCGP